MGASSSKNDFSNKIGTGSMGAGAEQELEIDADMAMLDLRLKKLTSVRSCPPVSPRELSYSAHKSARKRAVSVLGFSRKPPHSTASS